MLPLIEIIDLSSVPDTLTLIVDQNFNPDKMPQATMPDMKEPEINLNGWLTIKAAAVKWGTSTQAISNWIKREKITYREFPELNGLRLVPGDYKPESHV